MFSYINRQAFHILTTCNICFTDGFKLLIFHILCCSKELDITFQLWGKVAFVDKLCQCHPIQRTGLSNSHCSLVDLTSRRHRDPRVAVAQCGPGRSAARVRSRSGGALRQGHATIMRGEPNSSAARRAPSRTFIDSTAEQTDRRTHTWRHVTRAGPAPLRGGHTGSYGVIRGRTSWTSRHSVDSSH